MRRSLPFVSLLLGTCLTVSLVQAQSDRFAYAITNVTEDANWSFLRKLNLQTGEYSQVLLHGNDASFMAFDAGSKKQLTNPLNDPMFGKLANAAFGTGVAAVAFDSRNNRLYYTPMFIDQLRYIDLKSMKVFYVTDRAFTGMAQKSPDQGNIITRMVVASDGNGYALTNDSRHLMQFTTGKKLKISDLGSLVDDPANKGISVHNSCSSYGGDMIADDDGNLYVFSARNNVFKVNIESKVATHLGSITGLPAKFTVNGAVVNEKNQIVVGSAVENSSCFIIDIKTLAATPFAIKGTVWHSSDLANSNLLASSNKPNVTPPNITARPNPSAGSDMIQVFPNPVTQGQFSVQFTQLESGNYTIKVTDVMGREVIQEKVTLTGENLVQNINLSPSSAKGVYLVKVTDMNNKAIYSTKIIVQ
jgi:hypothetical protein